jgi:flagellar biosynthesis protein FlhB
MAENEDGQEKTELPSEKRTREAKEKGQRPRSRELVNAAVLGVAIAVLWFLGKSMFWQAHALMRGALVFDQASTRTASELPARALTIALESIWIVTPLLATILGAGILASVAIGGLGFSVNALAPQWQRLDPLAGMRRIWGREAIAQFLLSMLRVAAVATVASILIGRAASRLLGLVAMPLEQAISAGSSFVLEALFAMALAFLLIAAVDVPYQLWSHRRRLMMTREELRQEHKESEGRPEVKAKLRRIQQEMSRGRMMEAVRSADVVVVNPTHYAVALVYDNSKMRSPRVVAKGVDEIAASIRSIAEQCQVPILSAPPLARTLYQQVQIGAEIPVNLYAAVAQILSYVFQLRVYRREGGVRPEPPILR